jgi:hypothetical protein
METHAVEEVEAYLFQSDANGLLVCGLKVIATGPIGKLEALLVKEKGAVEGLDLEGIFAVKAQRIFFFSSVTKRS